MEREILQKILELVELVNQGHTVSFAEDMGGNSITVYIDRRHSHCGLDEGSFDDLITSLHDLLVKNKGLSFA